MQTRNGGDKMDRANFCDSLCRQVLSVLGEEYRTELSQVRKNNGVMKDVLYVRKENSECIPCFYMDELYGSYCMGENEIGLAEYLSNVVLNECDVVKEQAKEYLTKEWMVDNLFVRLLHFEKNAKWLENAVYVRVMDLAAVFYVLTEDCEEGVKSFQLPKNAWETLELGTAEEYFETAVENTRRLFPEKLWCLEQRVAECEIKGDEPSCVLTEQQGAMYSHRLYVLTNHRRINGGMVMMYPGVLRRLSEKFSGSFYVIPSSIHEVLLLKATEEEDANYLNRMVRAVNEQQVAPEEVLADYVYFYDAEEQELHSLTGN